MMTMRSIGKMEDPHISDLIMILWENVPDREKVKREFLLRLLLESVFDGTIDRGVFSARIASNREGLAFLLERFGRINDRLLKTKLVDLIPEIDANMYGSLLEKEGFDILAALKKTGGACSIECETELLAMLDTMSKLTNSEFLDLCIRIAKITKSENIYSKAIKTIQLISNKTAK